MACSRFEGIVAGNQRKPQSRYGKKSGRLIRQRIFWKKSSKDNFSKIRGACVGPQPAAGLGLPEEDPAEKVRAEARAHRGTVRPMRTRAERSDAGLMAEPRWIQGRGRPK